MLNGGHINKNMQQFMEKDRKVCRFYAIHDDLITGQFERRPFLIMYFLADDTIQIREQYPLNCGRDAFALFCKRQRVLELLGNAGYVFWIRFFRNLDFRYGDFPRWREQVKK